MRYGYRAYDSGGKIVKGEVAAESREMALEILHRRGELPLEILDGAVAEDKPWWDREITLFRRVPLGGLALFTRELATLVKADLPLDETLRIVALQPSLSSTKAPSSLEAAKFAIGLISLSHASARTRTGAAPFCDSARIRRWPSGALRS
jgi:type II secretory pathway component PulF